MPLIVPSPKVALARYYIRQNPPALTSQHYANLQTPGAWTTSFALSQQLMGARGYISDFYAQTLNGLADTLTLQIFLDQVGVGSTLVIPTATTGTFSVSFAPVPFSELSRLMLGGQQAATTTAGDRHYYITVAGRYL